VGLRQIIRIDEDLCTGCGECVPDCAEGALEIVDGKVRVVADALCDGLGACIGGCPEGALTIEEREAPDFDEVAVEQRLHEIGRADEIAHPGNAQEAPPQLFATPAAHPAPGTGGCPGSLSRALRPEGTAQAAQPATGSDDVPERDSESLLANWPVQLGLVNPMAPFLRGSDLLIAADCAPVAYRMFHEDYLDGRSVVIACPKLDDAGAHFEKLAELFHAARPRSVTVLHMEVPCCFGLSTLVSRAAAAAGVEVRVQEAVVTVRGEKLEREAAAS
jgi:NAD-dependent dihydropyrimidine dehydrogenase PreA subunit